MPLLIAIADPLTHVEIAAEAAELLKVPESWLRKKAAARLIPCTFLGKHLRFSDEDLTKIVQSGAKQPVAQTQRRRRPA